jgi:hypothetical protein
MMPDAVVFGDSQPIWSEVRVGNDTGIPVYWISTLALFLILKDRSLKNRMLKDCLYIPGLMKSRVSWSKLKSLNQHYFEDRGDMFVNKIVNDKVILWGRGCLRTHLFNISIRPLKAHITYTFWHKGLEYPSYDLIKYVNMISDGDHILTNSKKFDYDSYLQSKSIHKVPKIFQDYMKSKFDVIHSDMYRPLDIQSLCR